LSQGAAIPLDSVPYFKGDLRRIALTAVAMFILLVGGALLIH
jgi:hypothetical protein